MALSFVLAAFLSCSERGCGRGDGFGTTSVVVEPVKVQESSPTVTVPGILIPRDRVQVNVANPGKVAEVYVNKGDIVVQGAQLARLSDEEINLKMSQLKSAKKEAEASLEKNAYLMKNRDRLLEEGKLDRTQYEGVELEVSSAEGTLNRIKTDMAVGEYDLAHMLITSQVGGVIIEKNVGSGQSVVENQILFEIVSIDPILVSFSLSADESAGINVGTAIKVRIEDLDNAEYNASVVYIGPEVHQPGKTFDVWASVPNPGNVLKIGMMAMAEFTSTNIHKVIVVPSSAIISRDRDKYVFTVSEGAARQTRVSIRNIHDGIAEISSGLAENDLVVAKGAQGLQNGTPLDVWRR